MGRKQRPGKITLVLSVRKAMPNPQSKSPGTSWQERALDRIKPQPAQPHAPTPPPVDKAQWEHSVESHRVNKLTVRDIGLIVFNEMQSYKDTDSANESVGSARQKIAHTIINADTEFGAMRSKLAPTASPIEPSAKELRDPRTRAAYQSSLTAAREAYLSLHDPTHGATNFDFRTTPDRGNLKFQHGTPEGLPLKTQSGPFENSYLKHDVPSKKVYVDTFGH